MRQTLKNTIFTLQILFCSWVSMAQTAVDDIRTAISIGNVNGIALYFDNNVSMNITGSQASYSRSQAEMVLRDFFKKNSPKKFDIERNDTNHNMKFSIGTLFTSGGIYHIYFSLKQKGNSYSLQEIRIEK